MATTVEQRRNFARETIEDARLLREIRRRAEARGERWNALALSTQAFDPSDFDGQSGIEHLTPESLTGVITTLDAFLTAVDANHMGNLERAIP